MINLPHLDRANLKKYDQTKYTIYDSNRNRMMGYYTEFCAAVKYAQELSLPNIIIQCELSGEDRRGVKNTKRFSMTLEAALKIVNGPGGDR